MNEENNEYFKKPRRPHPPTDIKLNGPHEAFHEILCEAGCGEEIEKGQKFYFVQLRHMDKSLKMCPKCTKEKIL